MFKHLRLTSFRKLNLFLILRKVEFFLWTWEFLRAKNNCLWRVSKQHIVQTVRNNLNDTHVEECKLQTAKWKTLHHLWSDWKTIATKHVGCWAKVKSFFFGETSFVLVERLWGVWIEISAPFSPSTHATFTFFHPSFFSLSHFCLFADEILCFV